MADWRVTMADLEELAVKRDRGYLVRLVVALLLGLVFGAYLWRGLTNDGTKGCVADTIVGGKPAESTLPKATKDQ